MLLISFFFHLLIFLTSQGHAIPTLYPRIGASSATDAHPAQAALSPRPSGGWIAAGPLPQWLALDLGDPMELHALHQTFPVAAAWHFLVESSDSGSIAQPQAWQGLAHEDGTRTAATYDSPLHGRARYVRLTVLAGGTAGSTGFAVRATPLPVPPPPALVAAPSPAGRPIIVMQSCDLWSSPAIWQSVLSRQPGNRPLVGTYDDAYPAVTDARIAQARAAGIDAFQSCWFRQKGNAGQPVIAEFEGVIRALSATAHLRTAMRWSLFWDNANPASDGVTGTPDFLNHVARFWIDTYLRQPNYLRVNGRPLIVIGHPDILATELGGTAAARRALDSFRAMARDSGAGNPLILGCHVTAPTDANLLPQAIGLDGVMAYSTPIFTGLLHSPTPTPAEIMAAHRQAWALRLAHSHVPPTQTVSIGYDARIWTGADIWYRLPPSDFATLLREALTEATRLPPDHPGHSLIFLDNWNEYGEGHFLEPSVAHGHADLDAIAAVLAPAPHSADPALTW